MDSVVVYGDEKRALITKAIDGKFNINHNIPWKINKRQNSTESVLKFIHWKYTVLISEMEYMET